MKMDIYTLFILLKIHSVNVKDIRSIVKNIYNTIIYMEVSKILLIVLVVVGIIHLLKNTGLVLPVEDKTNAKVKNNVMKKVETRGLKTDDKLGNFPIPLTSSDSTPLNESTNNDITLINNSFVADPSIVNIIRNGVDNKESHYPKYYRKDLLSGNTVGTSEYTFAETTDEPSLAWSDQNVSQYPKYYKSDFKGGLTNVGSFFDQSNKYVDITGPRSNANVGDVCYTDSTGDKICLENDKLINIAPQVVDNKKGCDSLNSYNLLQYSNYLKYGGGENKVINGSPFYDNVKGSYKYSSTADEPLKEQVLSCSL